MTEFFELSSKDITLRVQENNTKYFHNNLIVTNKSETQRLGFRLKCTNIESYFPTKTSGIIKPGGVDEIKIIFDKTKVDDYNRLNHKFALSLIEIKEDNINEKNLSAYMKANSSACRKVSLPVRFDRTMPIKKQPSAVKERASLNKYDKRESNLSNNDKVKWKEQEISTLNENNDKLKSKLEGIRKRMTQTNNTAISNASKQPFQLWVVLFYLSIGMMIGVLTG